MNCKRCGIEMRVDSREKDGGIEQMFICRNPQCGGYLTVQETVQLEKEETEHAENE